MGDWLNETFAESLALLYIRNLYGEKEYSIIIDKIKLKATKLPAVKTKDGSRPDGVHVKVLISCMSYLKNLE